MDRHEWSVTYPVVGQVSVYVEAETEEEAIEAGYDLVDKPAAEFTWEAVAHVVEGNVFYGETNDIEVEQLD